jgi:hypothetical protein
MTLFMGSPVASEISDIRFNPNITLDGWTVTFKVSGPWVDKSFWREFEMTMPNVPWWNKDCEDLVSAFPCAMPNPDQSWLELWTLVNDDYQAHGQAFLWKIPNDEGIIGEVDHLPFKSCCLMPDGSVMYAGMVGGHKIPKEEIVHLKRLAMAKYQVFDGEGRLLGMVEADNSEEAESKAKKNKMRTDLYVREVRYRTENRVQDD